MGAFLLINTLLSYLPLGQWTKFACVLALGILLILGLRLNPAGAGETVSPGDFRVPRWLWLIVALLALWFRFSLLTTYEGWPGGDESLQGLFAIELNRHWSWQIFYYTGQHPGLWLWILRFIYPFSAQATFNFWFMPALVSVFFVLVSARAALKVFPKGTVFLFFTALSFGFWPLYFGRFCLEDNLVPPFEALVFLCLAGLWKAEGKTVRLGWAIGMGLAAGVGAYGYLGFFSVIAAASLAILAWAWGKRERILPLLAFLIILLVLLIPMALAAVREHVGGYMLSVSVIHGSPHWRDWFLHAVSFITTFFWGPWGLPVSYGPVLGGYLNPVEDAFFLFGLIEVNRWKDKTAKWFMGLAFILFLLPGFLTADVVEMYRVIPLMPVVYLLSCLGFGGLWRTTSHRAGKMLLILLAGLSLVLNLYHMALERSPDGPLTQKYSLQERIHEGYWAYRQFEEASRSQGPGLVFSDFLALDQDHSLHVMCYSFNALLNPSFDPSHARWAGLLTNVHYGAYLQARFPGSRWVYVTPPGSDPNRFLDGGAVAGIIPITPENRKVFDQWSQAHDYFQDLSVLAENSMNDQDKYSAQVAKLPAGYALMEGDPFLESVYGEWVAQYHIGMNLDPNVLALERAIQKGYPTANLYFKLGNFLATENKIPEAERAYALAVDCQPNHTQAALYLKALQSQDTAPASK